MNPVTTTLLVTNIHCPSCVSYAEDVLRPIAQIHRVDVSIIDHTIRVQHDGNITSHITDELLKAAFEIRHVSVNDFKGTEIYSADIDRGSQPKKNIATWPIFMSKAQRKHIANCVACQTERSERRYLFRTNPAIRRVNHYREQISNRSALATGRKSIPVQTSSSFVDGTPLKRDDEKSSTFKATLTIDGMTCASCSGTISTTLQQMDIVKTVNVNLLSNSAAVVFQGNSTDTQKLAQAVEELGYGASVEAVEDLMSSDEKKELFKASLSIEGMTCGSCVGTITRGLKELPLLMTVAVDLVGNSAVVKFEGRGTINTILTKIEDLGYDASLVAMNQFDSGDMVQDIQERTVCFDLSGMYCPNCPIKIATSIRKAFSDGVIITQHPQLEQPRLVAVYKPQAPHLTIRSLKAVIERADPAIIATIYQPPSVEERSRHLQRRERNRILRHLFVTFLVAIPTFIIGIVYMSLVPPENKTRKWFEEPIWSGSAMRMDWVLFILTTPTMFYGTSIFHTRALKEIWSIWRPRSKTPLFRRFYRFGSMNLLISAGTSVAYFSSLAILIMDATSPTQDSGTMQRKSTTYFDTVTFLTLFILVGRFLEAYSKAKTGDAVAMLSSLRPSDALLFEEETSHVRDSSKSIKSIPVDLLEVGDLISIPHGKSPPTDGLIDQDGTFMFDESSLTGEAKPVKKARGDKIFSGTVNISDPVQIKVTELGGKSMLDQIVAVVREGQAKRAPVERIADIITGYFVPVITLLAINTWIIWLALGKSGILPRSWLDIDRGGWAFWSVEFAIAVFVVACPCGIGLAAPTALFVGGGIAAKHGILVQGGGEAFQEASRIDAIVFDKTGTLTEGRMEVVDLQHLDPGMGDPLQRSIMFTLAQALETSSTHPIATAITDYCVGFKEQDSHFAISKAEIKEIPGQGMMGSFTLELPSGEGATYEAAIGNERLMYSTDEVMRNRPDKETFSISRIEEVLSSVKTTSSSNSDTSYLAQVLNRLQSTGSSTAIFAMRQVEDSNAHSETSDVNQQKLLPTAVFGIADPLRQETRTVLAALRQKNIDIYMCTGDNPTTAQAIASRLDIPVSHVRAGVLPQDKASFIRELQHHPNTLPTHHTTQPQRRRIIAFVGDGTNDTPALTAADVSIALSSGSDVAVTSASFILLNSDLTTILSLIKLAPRVFRRVMFNFAWAAVYNVCLIPVAAGVFFPISQWRLSPVWASAAMAASSVSVVLSSLALKMPEVELGWASPRVFTWRYWNSK